ncbi:hypothetical protein AR687_08815 [Flavobacteriaceae bacterium CRH]|nr:hypothetical protein AR687_08815 [Flavobacteriaceae bacterium CRH]
MQYVTPEIKLEADKLMNSLLIYFGIFGLLLIIAIAAICYFTLKISLDRSNEKFKSNVEKQQYMNLEIWKQQKDLMFDFVNFLEEKIFNNSNLNTKLSGDINQDEKEKVLIELNKYYAKLYLVMETSILDKVNNLINKNISVIQRYYLYKELRKQLIKIIHPNIKDSDFPYIAGGLDALVFENINGVMTQRNTIDLDDLKNHYPFVEEHEIEKDKIKTLPFFG